MAAGIPVCDVDISHSSVIVIRRLVGMRASKEQQGLRSYRLNLNSAHTCVGKPPVSFPLISAPFSKQD